MEDIHHYHDKTYKLLFSHPKIIKDLLTGFIEEDFVKDVDFDKIQKLGTSYVSDTFKERETDLILKLDLKGETAYLYALIEFQSSPDKYIALRVLSYMLLFYEDLIATGQVKDKLPPVFPLVIYTGEQKCNAPLNIEELIEQPYKRLRKYVPCFTYHMLDLHGLKEEQLSNLYRLDNILAAFFNLVTKIRTEEIIEAEKILIEMVDFTSELGRFIKIWLGTYLKKHNIPFNLDAQGGSPMLATAIKNSIHEAQEKGIEEGIEKGVEKGKLDTAKKMLSKNYPLEEIAEVTGLSLEEIKKIQ
jgi:predicted transposase/invertase (TIGR01784 family)